MKTSRQLLLLAAPAAWLCCCADDDPGSLILNQSGKLSVEVLDEEDLPVEGATIDLSDYSGYYYYDRQETDENGKAHFGAYNAGNYLIRITADVDNRYYNFTQVVQIVSGVDKNLEMPLGDYQVAATVDVFDDFTLEPITAEDYMVSFIHGARLEGVWDFAAMIPVVGITSAIVDGRASFETLPVGSYYVLLHHQDNMIIDQSTIMLTRYQDKYLEFYESSLRLLLGSKAQFTITSVRSQSSGEELNYAYSNVSFDVQESTMTLTFQNGTSVTAGYTSHRYSDGDLVMLFDWPASYQYWTNAEVEISGKTIELALYDYFLYDNVIITLK